MHSRNGDYKQNKIGNLELRCTISGEIITRQLVVLMLKQRRKGQLV